MINNTHPLNSTPIKKELYESLNGLRAYAALGIILMHVLSNITIKPSENYATSSLIPWFTDFTLLFMVVSGFSLCCGYYEKIKKGTITPNAFYKKRYARILPFFACLSILDVLLSPSKHSIYEMFANLTLCFKLLPNSGIEVIGVGWFLGIVFVFYMLFPFFVFLINSKKRAWIMLTIALILTWMATVYSFNKNIVTPVINRQNIVYCMPLFMSGGMVYLYRYLVSQWVSQHIIIATLGTLLLTIILFLGKGVPDTQFGPFFIELTLFTIWLIYAIGSHNFFLNNRAVYYLSGISMEIYLCHMVIFRVVDKLHLDHFITNADLLYWVTCIAVVCGSIVFAHLMKYYMLKPIVRWMEK